MMKETEGIIQRNMDFLPLHTNANIHEGNALRMDWKEVLPPSNEVKIMGNPPFSGFKVQSAQQRDDMRQFASLGINKIGLLDYVCGWYIKAADYINGTNIEGAFVSTNSISQGEQPAILWDYLYKQKMEIFFAYRTFNWTSESKNTAKVHCIIIGFCAMNLHKHKILYMMPVLNFLIPLRFPDRINPWPLLLFKSEKLDKIMNGIIFCLF